MTGFVVHWQRDTLILGCSNRNESSFTVYQGFSGSFTIPGLEPGNRYTITATVSNAAGRAPVSNAVTATTTETSKRLNQYCVTYPCYIHYCSTQILHEVPAQSEVVQSQPVV